jgi:hypothetical protein
MVEKTEVRQSKLIVPFIALFVVTTIVMVYFVYFSGKYDDNYPLKIVYLILTIVLARAFYFPIKRLIHNKPVLTFSETELEIDDFDKVLAITWSQVVGWTIDTGNNGPRLTIKTLEKETTVYLAWLDKGPSQIEELFKIHLAGPSHKKSLPSAGRL